MDTLVYESFADIGKPEPFTDQDGNGAYNAGEPFVDVNGNGQWDADMGEAGLGGAERRGRLPAELRLGRHHPDACARSSARA